MWYPQAKSRDAIVVSRTLSGTIFLSVSKKWHDKMHVLESFRGFSVNIFFETHKTTTWVIGKK